MCTNPQVAGQSKNLPVDECWNGLNKARYIGDLMGEGLQNQTRNPEVNFDVSRQNSVINQQILTLKLITTKLTHAYNGLDVEWQDSSDWSDSSGSGSGSGFGEEEPTEDSFGDIYFSTPSNPTRFIPDNRTPPKVSSATTRWQHSTILICATLLLWSFFQRQFNC
ncbi:glypican-6 [Trichonephila clavata]|uniref:Glypican-6 n=2 Tax=Trichonephila clavata TaxID=2740835 RepID=A0A8X6M0Y7_TRICU|nr:glypican-6 [Trichonephila clavata]